MLRRAKQVWGLALPLTIALASCEEPVPTQPFNHGEGTGGGEDEGEVIPTALKGDRVEVVSDIQVYFCPGNLDVVEEFVGRTESRFDLPVHAGLIEIHVLDPSTISLAQYCGPEANNCVRGGEIYVQDEDWFGAIFHEMMHFQTSGEYLDGTSWPINEGVADAFGQVGCHVVDFPAPFPPLEGDLFDVEDRPAIYDLMGGVIQQLYDLRGPEDLKAWANAVNPEDSEEHLRAEFEHVYGVSLDSIFDDFWNHSDSVISDAGRCGAPILDAWDGDTWRFGRKMLCGVDWVEGAVTNRDWLLTEALMEIETAGMYDVTSTHAVDLISCVCTSETEEVRLPSGTSEVELQPGVYRVRLWAYGEAERTEAEVQISPLG